MSIAVAPGAGLVRRAQLVRLLTGLLTLALGVGVAWFLAHPSRTHLVQVPGHDDRVAIWRSAFVQWRSSPLFGVGPDRVIHLRSSIWPAGTTATFAHNEYLQLLADGGLIAVALLAAAGTAVVRGLRRNNVLSSCAIAALVAFAVAGATDFDWHIPALALMGGWVAGIADGENAMTRARLAAVACRDRDRSRPRSDGCRQRELLRGGELQRGAHTAAGSDLGQRRVGLDAQWYRHVDRHARRRLERVRDHEIRRDVYLEQRRRDEARRAQRARGGARSRSPV